MDPTLRARILADLKETIPRLSPRLRLAAKYIVDHPTEFGLDPIRETARKAGVSTYTLVKTAKFVGFASFEEMRAPFRRALLSSAPTHVDAGWLEEMRARGPSGETFAAAAGNTLSIVAHSLERQQIDEMEEIVDMLFAARRVFLTAVRASYAIAYYLHYVGRMALPTLELIPRGRTSAIDDMIEAGEGDVLIAVSIMPYSRETIEACHFARERGMKVVMISDSDVISPRFHPDHLLRADVLSTHHFGSFSGMTALVEVLLALMMARGGEAARARIRAYEAVRLANNAYWPTKKT